MGARLFTKENMDRLTTDERAQLMQLQMSPRSYGYSDYLPEDCAECGGCGYPTLGSGRCDRCHDDWDRLDAKARGISEPPR